MEPGTHIQQPAFSGEGEKAWLALLLCWVAGFADAFGYLVLNNIFTSHISGNSIAAGAGAGRGDWTGAAQHAWSIFFFITGFFFGSVLETAAGRLHIRRRFSAALVLEILFLWIFFFFGRNWLRSADIVAQAPAKFYFLVATLAGAMGVQSASLRRVRGQSVHTPYVTGMLTQSVENAVQLLFVAYDRLWNRIPGPPNEYFKRMVFYAGLWLSFTIGAFCGGLGQSRWSFSSLLAPMGMLALMVICDVVRPVHD